MRLGEKKYSKDEIYKEFIFGPLKESALNALCIQEEIFENFNEIIKRNFYCVTSKIFLRPLSSISVSFFLIHNGCKYR